MHGSLCPDAMSAGLKAQMHPAGAGLSVMAMRMGAGALTVNRCALCRRRQTKTGRRIKMDIVQWFFGCPKCRFIGGWGQESGQLECISCGAVLILVDDPETDRALVVCPGCKKVLYRHSYDDGSARCPRCNDGEMEVLEATGYEYAWYFSQKYNRQ